MSALGTPYAVGQRLIHHGGSAWQVERVALPDGAFEGYYEILCIAGTARLEVIGGEVIGTRRRVHRDYLHGDGWKTVAEHLADA